MKRGAAILFALLVGVCALWLKHSLEIKLAVSSAKRPALPVEDAAYEGHSLKRYSLGFDNLVADLLWIGLLQKASTEPLNSAKVSWEYAQLEALTTLDPKFERAYPLGAALLSIFRRDRIGAKLLLEKWVRHAPTYWKSRYTLGYHLYFELKDYAAAAPQILTAAALPGAPDWLSSLGIRLLSENGALAQSLKIAVELYETLTSDIGRDRMRQRIRSLHFNLEEQAWQHALEAYRQEYRAEPKSLEALRPEAAREQRTLASLLSEDEVPEDLRPILAEHFAFRYDAGSRSIKCSSPGIEEALGQTGIYHPRNQNRE